METFHPAHEAEVATLVTQALADGTPLWLTGSDTKAGWGGLPPASARRLSLTLVRGIENHDPGELVLTARAGTPLSEIRAVLAARNQRLPFDPPHPGPLYGDEADGTLGGAVATAWAGSRRLGGGSVRDHVLGVRAVSGRGEVFQAGGRVVKNVTGFDLARGLTGSFGTLAALTAVTVRVLPAPETARTLILPGVSPVEALRLMAEAQRRPWPLMAAAWVSQAAARPLGRDDAFLALLLEGPAAALDAHVPQLAALLPAPCEDAGPAEALWAALGCGLPLARRTDRPVWRLCSAAMPAVLAHLQRDEHTPGPWVLDWGGGLAWLPGDDGPDGGAAALRGALAAAGGGGHATLMRGPDPLRRRTAVFQPADPAVARLEERLHQGFNPAGVLNPGRRWGRLPEEGPEKAS